MTHIPFKKMHALGNDFLVINNLDQSIQLSQLNIPQLADRHLGIGFDQLLLIESATNADYACRFFNADGSEAEQCGNGVRCVARFLHEEKILKKNTLSLNTKAGMVEIEIQHYDAIRVNMGKPVIDEILVHIQLNDEKLSLQNISMGNPHSLLQVTSIKNPAIEQWGPQLSTHKIFPQGANIGFMEIIDTHHIKLRTYERGVGETCACGTNACAAAVAGILQHQLQSPITIELAFGNLQIEWQGKESPVYMTGPASQVFTGVF